MADYQNSVVSVTAHIRGLADSNNSLSTGANASSDWTIQQGTLKINPPRQYGGIAGVGVHIVLFDLTSLEVIFNKVYYLPPEEIQDSETSPMLKESHSTGVSWTI